MTDNKQDWPEKYDINKLVTRQESVDMIIKGEKVSERRNDRYADVGETLVLQGHTFVVEDVFPQHLKEMTDADAKDEGFPHLEAYKEVLTHIHQAAVWDPEAVVWAHYLKRK